MNKIWSSKGELDIDTARDITGKLVVLGSAYRAGIFQAIEEEKDLPSLVSQLGADERALYIVLEALCAIGYAEKRENKYLISNLARNVFLPGGRDYAGGSIPHFLDIIKAWLKLPEIIKGEKPEIEEENDDVAAFMNAMASRPDEIVQETVEQCLKRKKDAQKVLDLGGGPGKYSKAFINRGLNVVLYDLPETVDYVSTEFGLKDLSGLSLKKGDFTNDFEKEFGGECFDIVFMGNICHIYSEDDNRKLIKRAARLLKKGGMMAIEDLMRGRSPLAEMFAVNMLANTEGGNTYTESQYAEWLSEAGGREIKVTDLAQKNNQLITAFFDR